MKVLIIDNFDSFVYNIYQYVGDLGAEVIVKRNYVTLNEINKINPKCIIISPGPGVPENAGNCVSIIQKFGESTPILGICLGHQTIGVAYGGTVQRTKNLMHGKTSKIRHDGKGIYIGIPNPFNATRYHSLALVEETLPNKLEISAKSLDDEIIMGVRHKTYLIEGLQFHPESILTSNGKVLIGNFLDMV
jgi:anthranilate synthase/aminodeoxychorismate synthase-like glutamine amidotransferase|tara:strand:- start:493 stop:1062 length:570 start_codon:yes stop_codon:yes gene_type:complete